MRYYFLLFIIFLTGCSENTPILPSSAYIKYEVGDVKIFEVTKEIYAIGKPAQKQNYQQQEIVKSVKLQEGIQVIEQDILQRSDATKPWQLVQQQILKRYPDKLIKENNEGIFQELIFPISNNIEWQWQIGNNSQQANILKYKSLATDFAVQSTSYQNCVIVEGENLESAINLRRRKDVYAPQIGLIYRENTNFSYCQSTPDCIGKGIIESGYKETYSLISKTKP